MPFPRIYADFNNLDDHNRLRLTCAGTMADLERHGISLREGISLTFYMDDADDAGQTDDILIDGVIQRNDEDDCWSAAVNWSAIRHASQESPHHRNGSVQSR